jgi:hypothetical protein
MEMYNAVNSMKRKCSVCIHVVGQNRFYGEGPVNTGKQVFKLIEILNSLIILLLLLLLLILLLFKLQMGFYPVAVYYNKTQHTNNTHHTK